MDNVPYSEKFSSEKTFANSVDLVQFVKVFSMKGGMSPVVYIMHVHTP